jgi:flagellin-specific chaperone FliS
MNFQQSYREATVQGANPVALVVRLYEQMIEDMRQVAIANERNDIPRRTDRIRHVILVIGHLQSTLDFARGGKVAQDLDKFLQRAPRERSLGTISSFETRCQSGHYRFARRAGSVGPG